jgi:hypothetical protein
MSIKLSLKQLLSIVFDDEGNNLYPECHLMNGSQVAYTVRLFSGRGNVWYGYTTPEAEFRENWLVTDITLENGKLFANSYQRV